MSSSPIKRPAEISVDDSANNNIDKNTNHNVDNNNASETANTGNNANNTSDGGDSSRQRKFFPRLKTLLSDEYEDFLGRVIDIVEQKNCAKYPMATADTPWSDAFDNIYDSVAAGYALPQGKNRLHKFKEKMIELWSAMQGEVTLGTKSGTHPIYRTALNQWETYQRALRDKTKGSTATIAAKTGDEFMELSDHDNSDTQRPRKKAKSMSISELRKSGSLPAPGTASAPAEAELGKTTGALPSNNTATLNNLVAMPAEMMESWMKSLSRLEFMLTSSGLLQQKLPSPLYELHRLKAQMPENEFESKVRTIYDQEIGRYLSHAMAQCRTCLQPGYLPHLLEGIDLLRRSPHSSAVRKSLDFTHKTLLSKYLKFITRESRTATESRAATENKSSNNAVMKQEEPPPQTSATGGEGEGAPIIQEPNSVGATADFVGNGEDGVLVGVLLGTGEGDEGDGGDPGANRTTVV